jgi:hypothetical protein
MGGSEKFRPPVDLTLDDTIPPDLMRLRDELQRLEERQNELDYKLRDALVRRKFSTDPASLNQAKSDEREYLVLLDRLMTRMRAVEAKLLLKRRSLH